jgi:hypothetical protein
LWPLSNIYLVVARPTTALVFVKIHFNYLTNCQLLEIRNSSMINQQTEKKCDDDLTADEWFVLDPLLGSYLLRELSAYKNASYKYNDLSGFLPELKGKT